ncbi:small nuclear ribonucleoprotein E [Camarhynchus parvulus]|uniref:small nuclear ribonucleoprotein E n=1 Tax=Geospiza parvula TaxID=87175 RepID=UPI0012381037|nr:small nuclear ribonucleoprotein E [Camarhynchus parvulus]
MAYRGQGQKVQKVMVQPINLIFRYLQNRSRIQVWLYEQVNMRIEGCIIGFDEYMNLVLDDAEEIHSKTKSRKQLGHPTDQPPFPAAPGILLPFSPPEIRPLLPHQPLQNPEDVTGLPKTSGGTRNWGVEKPGPPLSGADLLFEQLGSALT